jgi:aspartate 1-decarboxylase
MFLKVLRSKLHRGVVTEANVDYTGSITIDPDLYEAVNMVPGQAVLVADVDNGNRFETYVLRGVRGSRTMCINGAAARLVNVGDRIIVMAFAYVTPEEAAALTPQIVLLNERNEIARRLDERPGQIA